MLSLLSAKIISLFTAFILLITSVTSGIEGLFGRSDVVIIYTNDVHCAVDDNIGYAGLAAYRDETGKKYDNVTLVDCGDFSQGELIGAVSSGEYIVDIMNEVGYDMAVLGNHEFDYGMAQVKNLMEKSDFDYLGCNITYTGSGENLLDGLIDYKVIDYGDVQVGFIGVSTPDSIITSTPANFKDENGNFVYGFEEDLYGTVQKNVLEARLHGADYVVILSHLGDAEGSSVTSTDLIENTTGIDAVLDGHAHHVIESRTVENSRGDGVVLTSTGTKFQNIGQLKIAADGTITASLISEYEEKNAEIETYINGIKEKYKETLCKVVGSTDFKVSAYDENGIRIVRNREATAGNLCADAYREFTDADIAIINGGGVRADINAGDITMEDIIKVCPFGNEVCTIRATGRQIADALEWTSRYTQSGYRSGDRPCGENGGFLQVSGMKYTIDTSIASTVITDENGMFSGIAGERRVKDIMVLEDGKYVPIEMDKTYVVAGTKYVLVDNGDNMTAFDGAEIVTTSGIKDNEVLISYITNTMGGKIDSRYATTEGRITVI